MIKGGEPNDMLGDIKVLEVKKPVVCFVLNLIFVETGIYHCAQLVLQDYRIKFVLGSLFV